MLEGSGLRELLDELALLGAEPRRFAGAGVLGRVLWVLRRRDHGVDPLVRERPLEQGLRPGRDAEIAKRREGSDGGGFGSRDLSPSGRIAITATPSSAASGSSSRSHSRSSGFTGPARGEAAGPQRSRELVEGARGS